MWCTYTVWSRYPQTAVAAGRLWVVYSINKEDIGLSVVPVDSLL